MHKEFSQFQVSDSRFSQIEEVCHAIKQTTHLEPTSNCVQHLDLKSIP